MEEIIQFEWNDVDGPTLALIGAISEAMPEDVEAFGTLFSVIDPDALDDLFAPTTGGHQRYDGRVEFEFTGHRVVIKADGAGYIYHATEDPTPIAQEFVQVP